VQGRGSYFSERCTVVVFLRVAGQNFKIIRNIQNRVELCKIDCDGGTLLL